MSTPTIIKKQVTFKGENACIWVIDNYKGFYKLTGLPRIHYCLKFNPIACENTI